MAYLKDIVAYINGTLEQDLLQDAVFEDRLVIGIAQSLPRKGVEGLELLPSYVDHQGEGQYVGPDDDYDVILYHRVNGVVVAKGNIKTFGDVRQVDINTAKMSLVVFGRRDRLQLTNDELAILIQASFPQAADKALLQQLQFNAANINITDIVLNDLQVFQEEYQGIEYFLKPEQFLFKVNYQIESAFQKGCFTKTVS